MGDLCIQCGKEPVLIVTRGLCRSCYMRNRREGTLSEERPFRKAIFTKGLTDRYGLGILVDFNRLIINPGTLTKVAKKYGFSRERSRQIFNRLFDVSYRVVNANKNTVAKDLIKRSKREPIYGASFYEGMWKRIAEARLVVIKGCKDLGYKVESWGTKKPLIINDHRVTIVLGNSRGKYRYFLFGKGMLEACDFFICCVKDSYYIIPRYAFPKGIYIRQDGKSGIYDRFKERWDLLR